MIRSGCRGLLLAGVAAEAEGGGSGGWKDCGGYRNKHISSNIPKDQDHFPDIQSLVLPSSKQTAQ